MFQFKAFSNAGLKNAQLAMPYMPISTQTQCSHMHTQILFKTWNTCGLSSFNDWSLVFAIGTSAIRKWFKVIFWSQPGVCLLKKSSSELTNTHCDFVTQTFWSLARYLHHCCVPKGEMVPLQMLYKPVTPLFTFQTSPPGHKICFSD